MKKQFTCIVCPNGCEIEAEVENGQVISVTGHTCPRGEQYVRQELKVVLTAPVKAGTIVLHNVCGLDSDVIVTKNVDAC